MGSEAKPASAPANRRVRRCRPCRVSGRRRLDRGRTSDRGRSAPRSAPHCGSLRSGCARPMPSGFMTPMANRSAALLGEGDVDRPWATRPGWSSGRSPKEMRLRAAARRHHINLLAPPRSDSNTIGNRPANRRAMCRWPAYRSAASSCASAGPSCRYWRRALLERHHDALAVGRKARAKVMPGKLPTTSRWPVSILSSNTFGSVGAEGHVGQLLRTWAKNAASPRDRRLRSDSAHWRRPDP